MAVPLDAIRAIHNAFRKDVKSLDEAANRAAQGHAGIDIVLNRYGFLNEVLVWHALGEEEFVFPAVEKVAPLVAEAYEKDHRGIDSAFDSLQKAIKISEILAIARAAAAFNFFLTFHLNKEEAHLYRIFNEKIPMPDQAVIAAKMSQRIPKERFPEAVAWLFPLIGLDDRENMTRIWKQAFPAPVFAGVTLLIKSAVGGEWEELVGRIPELK